MAPRRTTKVSAKKVAPTATQLKYIKCVQRIFAQQHFELLKLDFGTNFCDPYSKVFMEDVDVNEIDSRTKNEAAGLLKEHRLDIFLHLVNKLVSSNRFVGHSLMQSILEMILTINQKFDETSETMLRRIQSASLLFEKIVDNFPPSWSGCSECYKNLLTSPVNMEIDFKEIRMNSSDGFVAIILALLENVFKDDADGNDGTANGFDSMMNFQEFERVESGKCCYSNLTRNEKIDRLFVVLNLLVKMMEIDLAIWIQRYPFRTRHFMSVHDTCPLIVHLLWNGKQCGETNMLMRDVLKLFTMAVWIDFPADKTDILARLVNLMSVAVNLSENCDNDKLISYPNIKRLTEAFASELIKSIESFPYTIDFYINVIDMIRSPIIRMLASVRILSKLSKEFENISLRKIVDSISNESYMQYDDKVDDVEHRRRSAERYPTYDPKKDPKSSKHLRINRDEYLTLIWHLFKSYVDVYRTHDILKALVADDTDASQNAADNKQYKQIHDKVANERNHRLDFDGIFKDFKELKAKSTGFAASDVIPTAPSTQCQNVYLDPAEFLRYPDDLENLVKLKDLVEQNVQLGDTFKKWRTAVTQYLVN